MTLKKDFMQGSSTELKPYKLVNLLDRDGRNVLMDYKGPINKTVECAPEFAYRTAKKLDENYEGALSTPWNLDYTLDDEEVFASLSKTYEDIDDAAYPTEFAIEPSHSDFLAPKANIGLAVEIRGVLDITPERFLQTVEVR